MTNDILKAPGCETISENRFALPTARIGPFGRFVHDPLVQGTLFLGDSSKENIQDSKHNHG